MKLNTILCLTFFNFRASASVPPGMEQALTTSNVPEDYLEYVYLLGNFPTILSRTDPRVSYGIYVPENHYDVQSNSTLPLLVDIHGTSRRISALQVADQLPKFADENGCAVLAPQFPAGFDGPNDLSGYKVLSTPSTRSDLAVLDILDEVAYRWPGINTEKIYLSGFSGGGQFAHRFLYLHSDRVAAASIGAPGRVTYPDKTTPWPQGISDVEDVFNTSVDLNKLKDVALQFVVGGNDTEVHGSSEFWEWLEEALGSADDLPPMGESRLSTVQKLRDSWIENGVDSLLTIVPGVGHDSTNPDIQKALWEFLGTQMSAGKN